MANLDTRNKRSSGIMVGLPWRAMFPHPDGAITEQADQQHAAYSYAGILADALSVVAAHVIELTVEINRTSTSTVEINRTSTSTVEINRVAAFTVRRGN